MYNRTKDFGIKKRQMDCEGLTGFLFNLVFPH